jgi:hypothetical protein
MRSELERELRGRMMEATKACKQELRWKPTAAVLMIHEHGAVEAARRMVMQPDGSTGFARCWESNRLDLAFESIILDPRFATLFTDEVLGVASNRLEGARANLPRQT